MSGINLGGTGFALPVLRRQLWLILGSQFLWLSLLIAIVIWWGTLLMRQAHRIAELEALAGLPAANTVHELDKLYRIVFWEAGMLLLLMTVAAASLVWLFLRDARRSRAAQIFYAGIAHELRTPMTGIRLQAETIAERMPDNDPSNILVSRLLDDASRLEAHLNQSLQLARAEGGPRCELQTVQLQHFMSNFLRRHGYDAGNSKLDVNLDLGDTICMADPDALDTVFRNLVENTLQHSAVSDMRIEISASRSQGKILLRFSDNGKGFQTNGKPGDAFVKGSDSRGSGIGLYLVGVLMRNMSGTANFKSDNGFVASLLFRAGEDMEATA